MIDIIILCCFFCLFQSILSCLIVVALYSTMKKIKEFRDAWMNSKLDGVSTMMDAICPQSSESNFALDLARVSLIFLIVFFLNFEIFSQDSLDRYVLFGYLSRRRDGIILFGDFLVHHFDLETDHVGFHWNNLFHSTSNNISFLFVRFFSLDRW